MHRASTSGGALYVRNIPALAARVYDYVIDDRPRILIAAFLGLAVACGLKYAFAWLLFHEGLTPREMRLQDGLTTGLLAGTLVWITLAAGRFRREQIRENLKVVGDLNHHIRNAVTVILHSHLLPEAAQSDAILESVERIDGILQRIVPDHAYMANGQKQDSVASARQRGLARMRARLSHIDDSDSQTG